MRDHSLPCILTLTLTPPGVFSAGTVDDKLAGDNF